MSLRDALRVVLHQIQSPDNLGAVARVMANFDLAGLWLAAAAGAFEPTCVSRVPHAIRA